MKAAVYLNSQGREIPCVIVRENDDGTVDVAADEGSDCFIRGARFAAQPTASHVHLAGAKPPVKLEAAAKAEAEAAAKETAAKAEAETKVIKSKPGKGQNSPPPDE